MTDPINIHVRPSAEEVALLRARRQIEEHPVKRGQIFGPSGTNRAQRRKGDQAFKRMIRRQKRAQARREREQPKKEGQDG